MYYCKKYRFSRFRAVSVKISVKNLQNKNQTGAEMHRLIEQYSSDINSILVNRNGKKLPFSALSLQEVFDVVRNIPYRRDTPPVEVISRPAKILQNSNVGMDCKKKAIVIAAYLKNRKIPFRLIGSSRKKNKRIHHVFPQVKIAGEWLNMDATYSHYRPFEIKQVTKAEVI